MGDSLRVAVRPSDVRRRLFAQLSPGTNTRKFITKNSREIANRFRGDLPGASLVQETPANALVYPANIGPLQNCVVVFDSHSSPRGENPSLRFARSFRAPRSRVA